MKICVVHRYPLSIIESTNPSLPVFLDLLVERGDQVTLVTYKDGGNHSLYRRLKAVPINMRYHRQNAAEVLLKSLLFVLLAPIKIRRLHKINKFDVIYCDDSFPLYELLIKLLTGCTVLIRRGDLMCAYFLERPGFWRQPLFKLALFIERYIWKKVDGISVITDRFRDYLASHGIGAGKIYVIEDSINFKKFDRTGDSSSLKRSYGISDQFIVMFHGVLMKLKDIETLVRAIPLVIREYKNIKFIILGSGEELDRLKKLAAELKVDNYTIFTDWIDYDTIQSYLQICNIGVPIRKKSLANSLIITTALLQYWAAGKPVLAPKLAAIGDIVQEDINGYLFTPGNPESLARKILQAVNNRKSLPEMGEKGRNFAFKKYNVDTIARKMCQFVSREIL